MGRLRRYWRIGGTGFGFMLFAAGAFLLWFVWLPLLSLFFREKQSRRHYFRVSISKSFQVFLRLLELMQILRLEIADLGILREYRGCLFLVNHPTLLDYVIMTALVPEATCMVKGELLDNFFMGRVIRGADYISNQSENDLLEDCRRRLKAGENILIFPEGTRTAASDHKLKRGAANIALRCGADVQFIKIDVSEPFLDKIHAWYEAPERKPRFEVRLGPYFAFDLFRCREEEDMPRAVRRLNREFAQNLYL